MKVLHAPSQSTHSQVNSFKLRLRRRKSSTLNLKQSFSAQLTLYLTMLEILISMLSDPTSARRLEFLEISQILENVQGFYFKFIISNQVSCLSLPLILQLTFTLVRHVRSLTCILVRHVRLTQRMRSGMMLSA